MGSSRKMLLMIRRTQTNWATAALSGAVLLGNALVACASDPPPAPTFPKPTVRRAITSPPVPPSYFEALRPKPLPFEVSNPFVDRAIQRTSHAEDRIESSGGVSFPARRSVGDLPQADVEATRTQTQEPTRQSRIANRQFDRQIDNPALATEPNAEQLPQPAPHQPAEPRYAGPRQNFAADRYRATPTSRYADPPAPLDSSVEVRGSVRDVLQQSQPPLNSPGYNAPPNAATNQDTYVPQRTQEPSLGGTLRRTEVRAAQDGYRVTMNLRDEDLRSLLDFLSKDAKLNIIASEEVKGSVSASFTDVRVEEALSAILRMTGYVSRREGDFLFVGTPSDLTRMDQLDDQIESRIYRTNYVTAAELQQLISPMLTEEVGVVTVSTASRIDIPSDTLTTGGDNFAGNEVIMVRDYQRVLKRIDQLVRQVDERPRQVVIEAMILSVNLDDSHKFGINFELFRAHDSVQLTSGSPLGSLGQIDVSSGGLSFGVLATDVGGFVNALETIGDTNVIAAPRLLCLNKQRAEILIGDQKGFISTTQTETSTTQTVEFLDLGTQLRIRPFISNDGVIRLEVHPELSTGEVKLLGGFALPEKSVTQVTTNIMCRDGATVVIGGLIREDLAETTNQVAGVGSIPLLSGLFSNVSESMTRTEIVVLITPRIVQDPIELAGEVAPADYHGRQAETRVQRISPIARHHYSERYYRLANNAWVAGNMSEALRYVHLSLRFKPRNLRAKRLLNAIHTGAPSPEMLGPAPMEFQELREAPEGAEELPATSIDIQARSTVGARRSVGGDASPVRSVAHERSP